MSFLINALRCTTVEPVLFSFMLGTFLKIPVNQLLIYKKTCIQIYNETFCHYNFSRGSCGHSSKEANAVQSETSQWIFYQSVAFCIPSIITALLFGSWSDKFGRKVVMLMPLIGGCVEAVSAIINIHYINASPVYLLFGNILCGMFGSFSTVLMAVFAYMADITKGSNRTWRIGLLESMTFLGGTIGELISGVLIDNLGFMAPFIIVLLLNLGTIIYVLVLLQESYFPPEQYKNQPLFTFDNFKGSVQVLTKNRPQNNRLYLILVLSIGFFIPVLVFTGTNDVIILFVLNDPFCFTFSMIGYFIAVSFIVKSVGVLIGIPVMSNILKFSDLTITCTGILTNIMSTTFLAFTKNRWQVFLAASSGIFNGVTIPSVRAMISKLVEFDEQGSLFAVIACAETFSTLIASLIFNNIYKATVSTLPGLCFLVMAGILLLPLCLMISFYIHQKPTNIHLQENDINVLIDTDENEA